MRYSEQSTTSSQVPPRVCYRKCNSSPIYMDKPYATFQVSKLTATNLRIRTNHATNQARNILLLRVTLINNSPASSLLILLPPFYSISSSSISLTHLSIFPANIFIGIFFFVKSHKKHS